TLLASFIGTTGASMLLIRPLLQTNRERRHVKHTVIFFIFLVSNVGGMLTPLGDPPLFLGYLSGVPFAWTFRLWPQWLFMVAVLLLLYFLWHTRRYVHEPLAARRRARRARAVAVLLGGGDAVLVPRQRADLPDVPRPRAGAAPDGRGGRRHARRAGGHQRRLRRDGRELLHRQRAQFHGEVDRRGGEGVDAVVLRLHALQRRDPGSVVRDRDAALLPMSARTALLATATVTILCAVLGLLYNAQSLAVGLGGGFAEIVRDHEMRHFYVAFYTMSAVCIAGYLALLVGGVQLVRRRPWAAGLLVG